MNRRSIGYHISKREFVGSPFALTWIGVYPTSYFGSIVQEYSVDTNITVQ